MAMVVLFWMTMNVLLWRSEYGDASALGSSLPVSVVWSKILETPDASGLEIRKGGEKIGYCRWTVVQEVPLPDEEEPIENLPISEGQDELDGMIPDILGYQLQLEGNLSQGADVGQYLRYGFSIHLQEDGETWTKSDLRVGKKGNWLQVATENGDEEITITHLSEGTQSELTFSYQDLENPMALLQGFGLPLPWAGMPVMAGLPSLNISELSLGVQWEAGTEFVTVAHTRVRVYYLRAKLLEGYSVNFMVSRAGEILRAELPNDIVLINDSFTGL